MIRWKCSKTPYGHPFRYKIVLDWDTYTKRRMLFFTVEYPAGSRTFYGDLTVWYEEGKDGTLSRAHTKLECDLCDIRRTSDKMNFEQSKKSEIK